MYNKDSGPQHQYDVRKYEPRNYPLSPHLEHVDYQPEEEVHLRDYISVILKRKQLVLFFLISVVVVTAVFTFMMTPVYLSTVVLKIDSEKNSALTVQGLDMGRLGADYYQTQYELLKSRSLAEKVITNLKLAENKDFLPVKDKTDVAIDAIIKPISNGISFVASFFSPPPPKQEVSDLQRKEQNEIPPYLSGALISRLTVTPVKNSELVRVSFESNHPRVSMDVTNAVADAFIQYNLASRIDASLQARDFLKGQIESTRAKVEESEKRLNDYASRNAIIFLDGEKSNINNQRLSELSGAISSVTTERIQKEALFRQVKEGGSDNPTILNNGVIQGLTREHASLEAEYYNLSRTFKPDYPKMKNLKSQMDAIQERLEREKAGIIRSLESDYQAALRKEANLTRAFETQKHKVLDSQQKSIEYLTLKREVDVNKELHNSLLQKYNQVSIAAVSTATNIQIVDKALYPKRPDKPNKLLNFLLSLFFGLGGGIGLAFLVEYFDNTVKDTRDIERQSGLPVLGMIPHVDMSRSLPDQRMITFQTAATDSAKQLAGASPRAMGPIAEAFRSIGTFITLSSSTKPPKTILMTSPEEKVGKTTVSLNTAMALAESMGKGIIIDADMRRPRLHHSLDLNNTVGLSTLLSGNVEFHDLHTKVIKPTSVKNLSVITSGPIPPNPSELLVSAKMQDLLDVLYPLYEFIILDSPPVMGLPDSVYLSSIVDGTVLVVKSGGTPRQALTEAKKIFRSINAKVLGVILNGVKNVDLKYGYHNYYYSSYFKDDGKSH